MSPIPLSQTVLDARDSWLRRKVGNAPLTPREAGRKPRRLQGLEHPGPGAHVHSPECGCRRRLPARGESRRTSLPFGISVHPAELRGAGRVRRFPVGRERAFAGGFQEGSGCDRLIGAASVRALAALAGVDAPPRMRTGRERDDILRLWTPPTAGVNVPRLSFVPSRSSVAPRSYQPALLLGPFRPPFRVSWLGRWGDAGLPFLGGPMSASRVSGHLATLHLVTSSVSH